MANIVQIKSNGYNAFPMTVDMKTLEENNNPSLDVLPDLSIYGTFWLNLNNPSEIQGTIPVSSGQGILFCLKQSSHIARQLYIGITSNNGYYLRHYTFSTSTWTDWTKITI